MSDIQENVEAAVANAAEKIANADSVEEAQQWQSVISNLTGSLQAIRTAQEPVDVPEEAVAKPPVTTTDFVDKDEDVGN